MNYTENVTEGGITLDQRAERAAASRDDASLLIEEFTPYLLSIIKRYANSGNQTEFDEFHSEAMLAFYEAIKCYDIKKGHFLPLARQIIQRRMLDRLREMYRMNRMDSVTLSFDYAQSSDEGYTENSDGDSLINSASFNHYEMNESQWMLAQEVEQFNRELWEWGITMEDLVEESPKHTAVREEFKNIISQIYEVSEIVETIFVKRYFPMKSVASHTKTSPKKLKHFRNYIIASLIIKNGEYQYLSEYL